MSQAEVTQPEIAEPGTSPLEMLEWDSRHFGFPVAKIGPEDLDDYTLERTLQEARGRGVSLVYWVTAEDRELPPDLLDEFEGDLVDLRAIYTADLTKLEPPLAAEDGADIHVIEHPQGQMTGRLLELGIRAKAYSRFSVDPRIPVKKARELYEIWTRKSIDHEMADVVLTAVEGGRHDDPLGMTTASTKGGKAQLGLLAVHEYARRKGIGERLINAANNWFRSQGFDEAMLITQKKNAPACR